MDQTGNQDEQTDQPLLEDTHDPALLLTVKQASRRHGTPVPRHNRTPAKRFTLLTGFEPFSKEKPANPSWEGIKELDGRSWRRFQLVAKQLPCVWGAPLENLPTWIAEYQPVAVFSFGQG